MAGLAMNSNTIKLVLDTQRLTWAEWRCLLKIFRDLFLSGICTVGGFSRRQVQHKEQSRNRRKARPHSPKIDTVAGHYCPAPKTSSRDCCFS